MARVGPQCHKKKNEARTCYVFDAMWQNKVTFASDFGELQDLYFHF